MTTRRERTIAQAQTARWRCPGPNGVGGYRYFSTSSAALTYAGEKDRIGQLEERRESDREWVLMYPPVDYYCQKCERISNRPASHNRCPHCRRVMKRWEGEQGR